MEKTNTAKKQTLAQQNNSNKREKIPPVTKGTSPTKSWRSNLHPAIGLVFCPGVNNVPSVVSILLCSARVGLHCADPLKISGLHAKNSLGGREMKPAHLLDNTHTHTVDWFVCKRGHRGWLILSQAVLMSSAFNVLAHLNAYILLAANIKCANW